MGNPLEVQQDNINTFAAKHDVGIIHKLADRGKRGPNAEGRPAFNEMMD